MCNFGILLTWTSEEGLSLFSEEMVEYSSLLLLGGGYSLQEREGFFTSGYLVINETSGHVWVKPHTSEDINPFIPTVLFSGRITGFVSLFWLNVILASC